MAAKSSAVIQYAWCMTDGRCWYCGSKFSQTNVMQVDHIVAECKGGKLTIDNVRPSCEPCNRSKHKHSTDEFREVVAAKKGYSFTEAQVNALLAYGIDVRPIVAKELANLVFYGETLSEDG